MNSKGELCIGMAGVGRATELHMNALRRYSEVPICYKRIIARRKEQLDDAVRRYGFMEASTDFEALVNDEEIDIIDICTPPYVHRVELLEELLMAKKHAKDGKIMKAHTASSAIREKYGLV